MLKNHIIIVTGAGKMDLKDLWAKTTPFQSVITHGLISGRVAQYLCSYYISDGIKQQPERELTLDDNSFTNSDTLDL